MFTVFVIILAAILLDILFGDPKRHPLLLIGMMARPVLRRLNYVPTSKVAKRLGCVAVLIMLIPALLLWFILEDWRNTVWQQVCSVFILYYCISAKSLIQHSQRAYSALLTQDISAARFSTSRMVSRDVEHLNPQALTSAVTESVLENGSDGIFAPIFWFFIAGPAGVVAYRIINTLDAMWGYKHQPFTYFGWFAARTDDVLNYIPSRLTALLYFVSHWRFKHWFNMQTQARDWESANAGYTIASGAWALGITLGGARQYQGQLVHRPVLGELGQEPKISDIDRVHNLIVRSVLIYLCILGFFSVLT